MDLLSGLASASLDSGHYCDAFVGHRAPSAWFPQMVDIADDDDRVAREAVQAAGHVADEQGPGIGGQAAHAASNHGSRSQSSRHSVESTGPGQPGQPSRKNSHMGASASASSAAADNNHNHSNKDLGVGSHTTHTFHPGAPMIRRQQVECSR